LKNNERGGFVATTGKDGGTTQLTNSYYGESMAVLNKGGENVVHASVGADGTSVIATKDKNGDWTGRLP